MIQKASVGGVYLGDFLQRECATLSFFGSPYILPTIMARKKKSRPTWNFELGNVIAGWVLFFLSVLAFFGDSSSLVGSYLVSTLSYLLGDLYRWIFVPIVGIVGGLIIIGRLSWNSVRFIGLLLYLISLTSVLTAFRPYGANALLDFSGLLTSWFGRTPAILALIG